MFGKTKKSVLKRIKFTKRGKLLKRSPGQSHFRAKKSRRRELAGKRWKSFDISKKTLNQYIN